MGSPVRVCSGFIRILERGPPALLRRARDWAALRLPDSGPAGGEFGVFFRANTRKIVFDFQPGHLAFDAEMAARREVFRVIEGRKPDRIVFRGGRACKGWFRNSRKRPVPKLGRTDKASGLRPQNRRIFCRRPPRRLKGHPMRVGTCGSDNSRFPKVRPIS